MQTFFVAGNRIQYDSLLSAMRHVCIYRGLDYLQELEREMDGFVCLFDFYFYWID